MWTQKKIAETLKTNTVLMTLDLNNNGINDGCAKELAEALKTNTALTKLNLYDNSFRYAGAKELAEALKINTVLMTLNLSYNYINNRGAKELARISEIVGHLILSASPSRVPKTRLKISNPSLTLSNASQFSSFSHCASGKEKVSCTQTIPS